MQLLKSGILLTFLYFSWELIKSIKKEKEARKELETAYERINQNLDQLGKTNKNLEERNEDMKSLLDISKIAAGSLESQNNTQRIVDSVPEKLGHLNYLSGILTMYDKEAELVRAYSVTESEIMQKAKKLLDKPFRDYYIMVDKESNLIVEAIETGQIKMGDNLSDFVSPPVDKKIAKIIQKIAKVKAAVALPIFIRGQVVGAFTFLVTKPLLDIGERDIALMTAFVNHIGVSIDNAMLFEKTVNQVKELEQAKAKLEQTLKMKGEFVHLVSHQLRTPLTVVRGLVSMWYDGDFEKMPLEKQEDFKFKIKSSVERLNNITNQMIRAMEFEGGINLKYEQVDLLKVLKDTVEFLRPNFEKKGLYLKFENRTKKKEMVIEADPSYISHVFNNLIDNAEKYTVKGGVKVTLGGSGRHVCTKIKDTGVGITPENEKRLFKKFSRGVNAPKENPSGSGLGLFVAKQIVDEHRGKITFESKGKDQGTMFTVTLPITQSKS